MKLASYRGFQFLKDGYKRQSHTFTCYTVLNVLHEKKLQFNTANFAFNQPSFIHTWLIYGHKKPFIKVFYSIAEDFLLPTPFTANLSYITSWSYNSEFIAYGKKCIKKLKPSKSNVCWLLNMCVTERKSLWEIVSGVTEQP